MPSRRELLTGIAGAGAALLAGCVGAADPERGTDDEQTPAAAGGAPLFEGKLLPGDGVANDKFGDSVAVSADGSTVLVGTTARDEYAGVVHVFERTGEAWLEQATLVDDDPAPVDRFGSAVALSADGRVAVVGARLDVNPNGVAPAFGRGDWGSGSVFVFEREGDEWTRQAKLWASDGVGGDVFGEEVALSADGTVLLVGAHHVGPGTEMGAVYVFERDGAEWHERATLVKDDRESFENFGDAVALSADGTLALVGAHGVVREGDMAGAVYVFERDGAGWVQRAELVSADIGLGDRFGERLALSQDGTRAVVAAPGDNSASVFEQTDGSWTEVTKLPTEFGRVSDVALSGDGAVAVVGNPPARDDTGEQTGAVPVFQQVEGEWVQRTRLLADDREPDDGFGAPVAVSADGTTLVVVARQDDNENGESAGAAYVYRLS